MTTGALIFAFNNEQTDYLSMAAWSAKNIHRHLGIPVAVVTDYENPAGDFDYVIHAQAQSGGQRYFSDYDTNVTWHNTNRMDEFNQKEEEYKKEFALAIEKVLASKAFTLG
jgi:hypothetical protein